LEEIAKKVVQDSVQAVSQLTEDVKKTDKKPEKKSG